MLVHVRDGCRSLRRPEVKQQLYDSIHNAINEANLNGLGEAGDGEVTAEELVEQELKCFGAEAEREGWCQQDLRYVL